MRSFINATMIQQSLCSSRRDGQELLPQLIDKLITASVPHKKIKQKRIPHGDQISLSGADGILVIDGDSENQFIPSGISLWETSTSNDPKTKADDDFSKAEKKLAGAFPKLTPAVTQDKAEFVFVTSKAWDSTTWRSEKSQNSTWKDIRILDAVDLEKWLEQCPAVMLWFIEACGLPSEGLFNAEQYIKKQGIQFDFSLSPELIIAGRNEIKVKISNLLSQGNQPFCVYGESLDEAAAFLAASVLIEKESLTDVPPLIFANGQVDLNTLATFNDEIVIIPLDSEALSKAKNLSQPGWRIVTANIAGSEIQNKENAITLGKCKRASVEHCLVESIGISEHKAIQIARDSKGSLAALLWMVGSGPIAIPHWATCKDATTHASLILAGSWIGNNENDTNVIERLSKKESRDIETLLQSALLPSGPWIHWGIQWLCASKDYVWSQLAPKITETMLTDFQQIISDVVGESDPSLELNPSERYIASVLGKVRKYSSRLRKGLVDSLARLAIVRSDGEVWANKIIRNLLDPKQPDVINRWLSLVDVYSELAEAAPGIFLDSLEAILNQDAKLFFPGTSSKNDIFGPTSAHVYLLWALERLAWLHEYFARVLSILARLAENAPEEIGGNNPKKSLITILLPWSPQHNEKMEDAAQAVEMLYRASPDVAWYVAEKILPGKTETTSPNQRLEYRGEINKRKVTVKEYWKEYWEFVRSVVEMMIHWAGKNTSRWASLVKAYPKVQRGYPEVGQLITDALTQVSIDTLSEADKSVVHDALREVISHHREFPDTEWALPDSDLELLDSLQDRFKPKDAVLLYSHLFSWNPEVPDSPMKPYEEGWDEWIAEKRIQAVKAVYDQDGLSGIFRLAKSVVLADVVGYTTAELKLLESEIDQLLQRGLSEAPDNYAKNPLTRTSMAYVWSMYKKEGEEWLEDVLTRPGITWTPEAYANLALGLSASPTLWKRLKRWGEKADKLYWKNVEIHGDIRKHWPQVLDKWKVVTRPWSSLELLARLVDERHVDTMSKKPSAEQVIEILNQALESDESVEPLRQKGQMLSHYAEQLFLFLDTQGVDPERLAQLEWGWLRVIERTKRGVKVLPKQVTSSPKLFVELLKVVYRAEGEPNNKTVSENERVIGKQAAHLLQGIHTIPGYLSNSGADVIDSSALRYWVIESRKLAKDAGRLQVCDSQIGQILSYSPPSPDGSWPCVEVRDLIEEIQSSKLENGFRIGRYNQRGVIFRGKGGKQEWDLVKQYQELAEKVRHRWPRTSSILESIAKGYENEAKYWDEQAKRDEYE